MEFVKCENNRWIYILYVIYYETNQTSTDKYMIGEGN